MVRLSTLTDLELSDLLREDDEAAFDEIYHRYAARLTAFAVTKLFDVDDAKDIIHDLFVRLWEKRNTNEVKTNLAAYLFSITRFLIIDRIRRNITHEQFVMIQQAFDPVHPPEVTLQIAAQETQQAIEKSLDELSPRVKEVYLLSREENLTTMEIAQKLGLSEQTVKNQLTTALKHLRQSLHLLPISVLLAFFIVS